MKACPQNFPGRFYWYGGRRRGVGKWVEDLLADQLSYQSTTANGESEVLDTNDLVDEDDSRSEDAQSDVDIDEGTSKDTEDSHTEDAGQFNTLPHLVTHERTITQYNLRRNPRSIIK